MLAGQRRRKERVETLREREREREYFNGKREKLNKIHAYIYIALELQCIAINGYALQLKR